MVVRVDLNVPIENGKVRDATRIDRIVPTFRELLDKGAAVIVLAHFERPKGKVVPGNVIEARGAGAGKGARPPGRIRLHRLADGKALAAAARRQAGPGASSWRTPASMPAKKRTIRRWPRSLRASAMSSSMMHFPPPIAPMPRPKASRILIPAYAGRAMEAELKALGPALEKPKRPLVAVVGGAKISTKLELIGNLAGIADTIVIGGGMANTFLGAEGYPIGKSLCERDMLDNCPRSISPRREVRAASCFCRPMSSSPRNSRPSAANRTIPITDVAADDMILDVGEGTVTSINAAFDAASNHCLERPARRLRDSRPSTAPPLPARGTRPS